MTCTERSRAVVATAVAALTVALAAVAPTTWAQDPASADRVHDLRALSESPPALPEPGDVFTHEDSREMSMVVHMTAPDGATREIDQTLLTEIEYVERIDGVNDAGDTLRTLHVIACTIAHNGKTDATLTGATLIIEGTRLKQVRDAPQTPSANARSWLVTTLLRGDPLKPAEKIQERRGFSQLFVAPLLPAAPVPVGASWEISREAYQHLMNDGSAETLEFGRFDGTARLVSAGDGTPPDRVELEYDIDAEVRAAAIGDQVVEVKDGSSLVMRVTGGGPVAGAEGRHAFEATVSMSFDADIEGLAEITSETEIAWSQSITPGGEIPEPPTESDED